MSQVWLITGSSRGLGRALAEAVLAAGHKLAATARDPAQLADLVDRYGERSVPAPWTSPTPAQRGTPSRRPSEPSAGSTCS